MNFGIHRVMVWLGHLGSIFFDPLQLFRGLKNFPGFLRDYFRYRRLDRISIWDLHPCLHEKTKKTTFDPHYLYQHHWALKHLASIRPVSHVDVGSSLNFVIGLASILDQVTFLDLRPAPLRIKNLESLRGDILALPFQDASLPSLSCLHVAEHIGLGRYGDPLNPRGTQEACRELARVLRPGGQLFFSLPVGRERVCFNAHRVHAPATILSFFSSLKLKEFSAVDDDRNFVERVDPYVYDHAEYACGLFLFEKL